LGDHGAAGNPPSPPAPLPHAGEGSRYLIQHSAGSGKTNSIAWTAHFLADLHDANQNKLFDSVLVVSDRNVLDAQLQEAIFDFERTAGVVATIKGESASKSGELAQALSGGKKIVVCTIQTFPFALKAVQELAATQGKRFAVIADEAHSSQTGEAASSFMRRCDPEACRGMEFVDERAVKPLALDCSGGIFILSSFGCPAHRVGCLAPFGCISSVTARGGQPEWRIRSVRSSFCHKRHTDFFL
jgi:hypothetical protein